MKKYTVSFFQNPKAQREVTCYIDFWEWFYSSINKPFWGENKPENGQKAKFIPSKSSAISICGIFDTIIRGRCISYSGLIAVTINYKSEMGWFGLESVKSKLKESEYILYCGFVGGRNTLLCIIPSKDPTLAKEFYSQLEKYFLESFSVSIDSKFAGLRYLVGHLDDPDPIINIDAKEFEFIEECMNEDEGFNENMLEGLEDADNYQTIYIRNDSL